MTIKTTSLLIFLSFFTHCANAEKPNIVWISTEDINPHIGAFGDRYALMSNTAPNIDQFAREAMIFTNASSNAPVCAVARTTLISGMYATSTGAQHMRSKVPAPKWLNFFPYYLQKAGYYTTNNWKTDYNLDLGKRSQGWNESSRTAHWRSAPAGKPFFAVFNFTGTHESQIRNKNVNPKHDPSDIAIPPYHPDTPEVRKDWAQYYDRITLLDKFFEEHINALKKAGHMENTIIFFWGDHGSGMPRSKRYAGWSGLNIPLIVYVPEKFKHLAPTNYLPGGSSKELVSFIDFAPTMLSIAGIEIPQYYQGRAFMGENISSPPTDLYGIRSRMDSVADESRTIMDGRYIYIRNFIPYLPHGQYIAYQMQTPTTRVWRSLFRQGKLNSVQSAFFKEKVPEELYDLVDDPYEINNLANSQNHRQLLNKMRERLHDRLDSSKDLLFWPEYLTRNIALEGSSPLEYYRKQSAANNPTWPSTKLISPSYRAQLNFEEYLEASEAERYWILIRIHNKHVGYIRSQKILRHAIGDSNISLKIVAAEYLAKSTPIKQERLKAYDVLLSVATDKKIDYLQNAFAISALCRLAEKGFKLPDEFHTLQFERNDVARWANSYIPEQIQHLHSLKK